MSNLELLLVVWGGLTAVLVVLLIYRSTLTMHEDDQLFLDESESHMEQEQIAIHAKVRKLTLPLRIVGGISGALIMVISGMWIYKGLSAAQ